MDCRNRQTMTASPAKPGGLLLSASKGVMLKPKGDEIFHGQKPWDRPTLAKTARENQATLDSKDLSCGLLLQKLIELINRKGSTEVISLHFIAGFVP